ncbi:HAD-IIB family hydrolase [Nocardioides sp. 1609]|uniref:HAD-IIB family hydrolase n=1 Tax=Nocardioides sp. 1609 TaxID=2508327 RepID=UPI00106F7FC4|nr:HAD-IIB family hydrolase [Nocardioides sp. 1609]
MLVATDLDGTLLRSDGTVSAATRRVLAAVEEAGVPVVFVTARPLRWMDDLWSMVGAHGVAIVSNGAIVYDVAAREVRRLRGLEPAAGLAVADAVRAAVPEAQLAIETVGGIRREPGYDDGQDDVAAPAGSPVGPLAELWDVPAVKLLVRHPGTDHDAFRTAVEAAVGDAAIATWTVPGLVEISAPGVTKAAALAEVCADLGVAAADVVAFGDMPNDVAMLTWAGTSYAVAGAHPSVLAAAHHVAPANDDDGVARVLARLVPAAAHLL